jgi:hypothetical protein
VISSLKNEMDPTADNDSELDDPDLVVISDDDSDEDEAANTSTS